MDNSAKNYSRWRDMLPTENLVEFPKSLSATVREIATYESQAKMYLPICRVLNSISLLVHESLGDSNADAILFYPSPVATPLNDYLGSMVKPDIHATVETLYELKNYNDEFQLRAASRPRKQWSQLASAIEVKAMTVPRTELQANKYAIRLYQYRPDLSTTICLAWNGNKLSVAMVSPLVNSTSFLEKQDIESLPVAYVTTLYNQERTRDKSMSVVQKKAVGRSRWMKHILASHSMQLLPLVGQLRSLSDMVPQGALLS